MEKDFEIEVKTALIKKKKNVSWLAKELGISIAYLSDILRGNRRAEMQRERIRQILNL